MLRYSLFYYLTNTTQENQNFNSITQIIKVKTQVSLPNFNILLEDEAPMDCYVVNLV